MIKVLNTPKQETYFPTCNSCGASLECTHEDTHIGAFGCNYITCPVCQNEIWVEDDETENKLTLDNLKFPQHFYDDSNAAHIDDIEVEKMIKDSVRYLIKHPDKDDYSIESGDRGVMVTRDDDYYNISVYKPLYSGMTME